MNIRRMHVEKLCVSFRLNSNRFIPEIDQDEFQGRSKRVATVDDMARSLREAWMLPAGPIDSVVDILEENGGIVIPCDFGTDLLDAMSKGSTASSPVLRKRQFADGQVAAHALP
jgi:hypothetical protein